MPSTVKIVVGAPNWTKKAMGAIDQHKRITLVVSGPQAYAAWEALLHSQNTGGTATAVDPVSGTVVLGVAIVVGVIAVVGLGVLAAVLMYAIHQGYCPTASHKTKGPLPFDDELYIDVKRC